MRWRKKKEPESESIYEEIARGKIVDFEKKDRGLGLIVLDTGEKIVCTSDAPCTLPHILKPDKAYVFKVKLPEDRIIVEESEDGR